MAKVNIDISVNQRDAQKKLDRLQQSTKQASKGFDKLSVSVQQSSSAFSSFVGNVAAIGFTKLIGGLNSFIGASVAVTGEIETLTTQFEVLTGSVGLANKAVEDLQQFAATTPFQFKDLAKAEQRLLSFGFTLEETQERMKDIGDVSAASGADISELALIFGQVRAAGKLTGERLLQFQERAIPIGPALSKSLGVAESSIKDLVSAGKIQFSDFEKAFQTLNDTGEFAFEGMIKRSRTLEGRVSTLKDNFELLQANIGSKVAPAFKALLSTLTLVIQRIQNNKGFQDFIDTMASKIPQSIQFTVDSFSFLINSAFNVIKGFNLLRSGITTAISLIVKSFGLLIDGFVQVTQALGLGDTALGKSLASVKGFKDGVTDALDDTAAGFAQSAAEISITQENVNRVIQQSSSDIQKAYKAEEEAAVQQANATVEAQTNKVQKVKELTQQEVQALGELKTAKQNLRMQEEQDNLLSQGNDQIFLDEKLIRLQEFFTAEQEATIQANLNLANTEIEKQRIITEAQTMAIVNRQKMKQKELEDIRKSEGEYTKWKQQEDSKRESDQRQTLGTIASLQNSNNKTLASIGKAAALTQIAIDGPQAVTKALAAFPPPFNFAAAAAVGTAVAAQAARVVGVNFEQGGIVPGTSFTGDNVSANVNSGEMILNRQQQSQLFNLANGQNQGSSGSQEIVVNSTIMLNDEVVGEAVSRQVANGLILGEVQ